jgi:hypothetical protein
LTRLYAEHVELYDLAFGWDVSRPARGSAGRLLWHELTRS